MSFNTEYRQQELYTAIMYLLDLRREWRMTGGNLAELADEWVIAKASIKDHNHSALDDWFARRNVAQYLRHVAYLLNQKYLSAEDVFSTFPEAARVLEVVLPLENAVIAYYNAKEEAPSAGWDRIARKWELDTIMSHYEPWYRKNRARSFGLHPSIPTLTYNKTNRDPYPTSSGPSSDN